MTLSLDQTFLQVLRESNALEEFNLGIEREGLRATPSGDVSRAFHPASFGSKLTHPLITTDYGESLMEFITKAHNSKSSFQSEFAAIHHYVRQELANVDEILWPLSMPAVLPESDEEIPVADYGSSHWGRLKSLYRVGLGHRYGRKMQMIAGLHYNFSLSQSLLEKIALKLQSTESQQEFNNALYFRMIRNYRRFNWLLVFLFGASPVVDESFLPEGHDLEKLGPKTWGRKYATSLRMSDFGYTSSAQEEIQLCYDYLETYIKTLESFRVKSIPEYEKIGLFDENGKCKQLNTNLLQIDNEFYSTIRPKAFAAREQSALQALDEQGVQYIELRVMDVDPFAKFGISEETINFLHLFLLTCLSLEDKSISDAECKQIKSNLNKVVNEGRRPGLKLVHQEQEVGLQELALSFIESMNNVLNTLPGSDKKAFEKTIELQQQKIHDFSLLPSARVLESSQSEGFINFGLKMAKEHGFEVQNRSCWQQMTSESLVQQEELEKETEGEFKDFLHQYFEGIRIQ